MGRDEFRHPLKFCAPEISRLLQGVTPVMGSGADSPCQGEMARRARGGRVGDYEHEVLIRSRPRWRFAQSLVAPGESQRSGFAGKRRSKGTSAVFAARRKRSRVDFATTSRHGQSNSPPAGGEIPLRKEPSSGPMRASGPTKKRSIIAPSSAPFGGTCPYPLCRCATSSLPLLAYGHFPLIGGIGPLTRGVGPQGEGL